MTKCEGNDQQPNSKNQTVVVRNREIELSFLEFVIWLLVILSYPVTWLLGIIFYNSLIFRPLSGIKFSYS